MVKYNDSFMKGLSYKLEEMVEQFGGLE